MSQIPLSLDTDIDTRAATSDYQRHADAFEAWKITKILLSQAQKNLAGIAGTAVVTAVLHNAQRAEETAWVTLKAVSDHIHRIRTSE